MTFTAIAGRERQHAIVVVLGSAGADGGQAPIELALREAIGPYGGHLEHLADGSTTVVFEVDRLAATDHAARAVRCALALRGVANGRPMAIAMGRVESIRELSSSDVLDRARQLLSQVASASSAPTPIALDEATAGLLDARFEVIERDVGLTLCGERALILGARTLLGRPTPCVGRDWELDVLTGILDECIDESKLRAVMLLGPAGIGKSRLGAEFVRRAQERHGELAIWGGRGDSLRAGSTLDLLGQALRGAIGLRGSEPRAERWDKIRIRVAEHVPTTEQERVTHFLGELIGAPFPGDGESGAALRAARQDAQLMSEQMYRAWLDFLQAETSAYPVLLLLEDLHWSDFVTVRFIGAALRDLHDRSWMVLALARPELYEVFPRLWADRQVQEIRLKGLGRRASERLVRQVLGAGVGPNTIAVLAQQADGNALYLEELIRATAEGKDKDTPLPATVLAMVETRLARLPRAARRVLRVASVFGEVCWEGGVVALLEGAMGPKVGELLATLVEQEVLVARRDSRFPGERELVFRHALLREGAYATLTADDQRLAHRLAGEWLEQRVEGDPMVLAGHFERGGQGARAAEFYLRAAEQALHVLDLDAAIARADLGLGCAPSRELRLALLGVRREVSRISGPPAEVPGLDRAVRDAWLADAPQPLADLVAALDDARNLHYARGLLRGLLRYLVALGFATRAQVRDERDDPAVVELLRTMCQRDLAAIELVRLLRLVVRPFVGRRGAHPIPELVDLVTPHSDGETDDLDPLLAMQPPIDQPALEYLGSRLAELLPELTRVLRRMAFVLDYVLVFPREDAVERWTGPRRRRRVLVTIHSGELVKNHPMLLGRSGRVCIDLWPLAQIMSPTEGAEPELFVFEGRGRHGARLISEPDGLEHFDPSVWEWIAARVIADAAIRAEAGVIADTAIRIRKTVEADWQDSVPVLRVVRSLCLYAGTASRRLSLEDIRQLSDARDAHEVLKIAEYLASERIGLLVAHFTLVRSSGPLELSDQDVQGALRTGALRDPETGHEIENWQRRVLLSYQISAIQDEQR